MALTSGGASLWARNAAACVAGALLAVLVARIRSGALPGAVLLLSPLALLATLLSPGQSGVHRWVRAGALNWHGAFLCLPAAAVALGWAARGKSRWTAWPAALAIQLELCLQPDASQATAFAAALLTAVDRIGKPRSARITAGLLLVLAAAFAWARTDPLEPVPEVEGIVQLASALSGPLAALCAASLAAAAASPLFALRNARPGPRAAARALSAYLFGCALAPVFGAFPVPLVGMGMSPIIGFWLGTGTLMAVACSIPDGPD